MSTATVAAPTGSGGMVAALAREARRNTWTISLWILLGMMLLITKVIQPSYGSDGVGSLTLAALPVAFAAAGQTIAVLTGGIDLSISSVMALTSVTAATLMHGSGDEFAFFVVVFVLALGLAAGAVNGALIVVTRVPDIIVTLAMLYVWAGAALLVLATPGGSATRWLRDLIVGSLGSEWVPKAALLLLVLVGVVWVPLRRSRLGLSIYAVGSDRLAAFRSGVSIRRTTIAAYALTGLFAALGGLVLTMSTGIGPPVPGNYLLASVAAVVLGGVSLAGGRGGMVGPIVAVFVLRLVRTDLTFLKVDPNYTTVIEGAIMVAIVMVGGVAALRHRRA